MNIRTVTKLTEPASLAKIDAIKLVRNVTGMTILESKAFFEGECSIKVAPSVYDSLQEHGFMLLISHETEPKTEDDYLPHHMRSDTADTIRIAAVFHPSSLVPHLCMSTETFSMTREEHESHAILEATSLNSWPAGEVAVRFTLVNQDCETASIYQSWC